MYKPLRINILFGTPHFFVVSFVICRRKDSPRRLTPAPVLPPPNLSSPQGRLWVQIIGELRRGVKLKKVECTYTPTEFELTPYEMLMDDIRSRRFKLRKVMVDGDIPPRVKKDAHALILEFIRGRPPLKKVRTLCECRRVGDIHEVFQKRIQWGEVEMDVC